MRIEVPVREPAAVLYALASPDPDTRLGAVRVVYSAFHVDHVDAEKSILRVGNYSRYSDADREQLLSGLVQIAAERGFGGQSANTAAANDARAVLRAIAFDPIITAPEAREVPSRVLRAFEIGSHRSKPLSLLLLGDLLHLRPPQAAQILALLETVATGPEGASVRPEAAISALRNACQFGLPTMRRIHAQRLARDPDIVRDLDWWAENGFRVERATPGPPCS